MIERKKYRVDTLDTLTDEESKLLRAGTLAERLLKQEEYHVQVSDGKANLVSSRVNISGLEDVHAPVLDIDINASLVPSSTPGHFHLYIEKLMTWEKYKKLLETLADCGIISKGYATASIARRASFVRKPGVKKTSKSKDS